MRKSLKKQILRGAQDDKDYVSNFGDRTLDLEVAFFKVFIVLFYLGGGGGVKAREKREEKLWIEGIENVIGPVALASAGCADHDYGDIRAHVFERIDEVGAWHVGHSGVGDDAIDRGKLLQGLDCFGAAVGGDDVEFCGLDD